MAEHDAEPPFSDNCGLPSSPLSPEKWEAIVLRLKLPPQLARVGDLILRDLCDKQIARQLELAPSTIQTYMERLRTRLRVNSRTGFVIRVLKEAEDMNANPSCPL